MQKELDCHSFLASIILDATDKKMSDTTSLFFLLCNSEATVAETEKKILDVGNNFFRFSI